MEFISEGGGNLIRLNGNVMRQKLEQLLEKTTQNGREKKRVRMGEKINGKVS